MKQETKIPLCHLSVGMKGRVLDLLSTELPRRRMLDLGLVPGTIVEVLRKSPLGDPVAYNIRGAIIALREEEALKILVRPI
ncbi:FeoA family protein [Anaerophilus nitritogenes]|uniref:FeoA family protein n=1 Tax=Anaerophilus nitritogenes TaxID=2498136 RepID=UPI00101BD38A|nr:FeoA family protein [Anaerophilus nitritogenes]